MKNALYHGRPCSIRVTSSGATPGCCGLHHPYLHLLYVIPLEYTKDLVALRNLGFEFPFIKNNDYPSRSLAARIGRYAWHVKTTDPCIPPVLDSPA
ncbi:hypothetical protein Taro_045289 [Colocasia esculenta]|uniref:Uncharacterized protein n=1 Tax=Colocasia esculenta TaxID=4460 RepID=A0A843X2G7_COLES|nr:hypothetical protein [Colocasia esculenta]